jgi:hypothetical protein
MHHPRPWPVVFPGNTNAERRLHGFTCLPIDAGVHLECDHTIAAGQMGMHGGAIVEPFGGEPVEDVGIPGTEATALGTSKNRILGSFLPRPHE